MTSAKRSSLNSYSRSSRPVEALIFKISSISQNQAQITHFPAFALKVIEVGVSSYCKDAGMISGRFTVR